MKNTEKSTVSYLYQIGLFLFIVFMPISISIRQVGIGILSITFLYDIIKNKRNIRFLAYNENKYLLLLVIYFYYNTFFISINKNESLGDLNNVVWQCFLVYFILYYLVTNNLILKSYIFKVLILSVFIQGIDGVYQYLISHDFIKNLQPHGSRLTASFDTPRIGNFVCLTLPAFFAFYFTKKELFQKLYSKIIYVFIFLPPIFLLIFSKTRSGWIGFVAFLAILSFVNFRKYIIYFLVLSGLILFLFKEVIIQRMALDVILNDPRFELWKIGLKLFWIKPFFGHGISAFNEAFQLYGLLPTKVTVEVPHPHNIYVQFLAETGLVGILPFLFFLISRLYYLIKWYILTKSAITLIYFAWIVSYLANAFSGHSFFRTWWLGIFMVIFAITKPDNEQVNFNNSSNLA